MRRVITTKPFTSQAQAGWAFANKKPFAKRWARQTGPYKKLPEKVAKKAMTVEALETFVSSSHYDAATAALMALGIPELPRAKEQLAPGISRIHGNLCNVHGKYGPCDKGLAAEGKKMPAPSAAASAYSVSKPKPKKGKRGAAGKKPKAAAKPKAGAKPKQTPDQKKAEAAKVEAENITKVGDATDLGDYLADLNKFGQGKPMRDQDVDALAKEGLMERGADGTPRQTSAGRAVMAAAKRGDAQAANEAYSRGRDAVAKQGEQAAKRQDAAGKRATAQVGRELAKRTREDAAKKRQAEAASKRQAAKKPAGGGKPPADKTPAKVTPAKPAPRSASSGGGGGASGGGGGGASAAPKPEPKPKPPEKAPKPDIAQPLKDAAQALSDGAEMTPEQVQGLVRNGLAKLDKDGKPILTSAGLNATKKEATFRVFKDARGNYRWVAQSSTAYQDRDNEIVSTKALTEDCAFADQTGSYGPLRWWHTPGLDLGHCDFNAMHGRVLIESGTFNSAAIAQKVAAHAPDLELSIGFLHLPTEPDAAGVFHHIRRFERSLVPRGKAANPFTAFRVKEIPMLDATKVAALKTLGFSDDDITNLQAQAQATEKAADAQQVAYKADEPAEDAAPELPDIVINGVTYKAFPPPKTDAATEDVTVEAKALPGNAAEDALDGGADDAMEEPAAEGGLTLSPEDLSAISDAVATALQAGLAQVMGAMDLEKKVAGHVQGLMAPFQATKDSEAAERDAQVATLKQTIESTQTKLDELLGLQPAVSARPTESAQTVINPWIPSDQQLLESIKNQAPAGDQFAFGDLVQNLFGTQTN